MQRTISAMVGKGSVDHNSRVQEKPFHEIILQVGDKENMNADTENGESAHG